jgi:hypothetical protein
MLDILALSLVLCEAPGGPTVAALKHEPVQPCPHLAGRAQLNIVDA